MPDLIELLKSGNCVVTIEQDYIDYMPTTYPRQGKLTVTGDFQVIKELFTLCME